MNNKIDLAKNILANLNPNSVFVNENGIVVITDNNGNSLMLGLNDYNHIELSVVHHDHDETSLVTVK